MYSMMKLVNTRWLKRMASLYSLLSETNKKFEAGKKKLANESVPSIIEVMVFVRVPLPA